MTKQKIAHLVATLDAETAELDKKVNKSQKVLKDYGSQASKAESNNKNLSTSFADAAFSASSLPGPLGNIGSQMDGVIGNVKGLGFAWTALGTGVTAAIGAMSAGLPVLAETERRLLQQEQLIKATGYSSGYTAQQLDEMARSVAMSTLTSTQEASKAIGVMLTFRSVSEDTFKRAIYLSQDMASVMGSDIVSAAKQLGKALEMPSTGLSALRESGVSFTKSQIEMVKSMEESGRIAEAQSFILSELDNQIGGAAGAEAGGLIGSVDTLGQATEEAFEAFTKWTGIKPIVKNLTDEMSEAAFVIRDFFAPTTTDEALDLMSERVKLIQEMNQGIDEAGGFENLGSYFGYTKSQWFNDQRRINEIEARLAELREIRDQQLKEEQEAEEKAAKAAEEREKRRLAEKKERKDKAAAESKARNEKVLAEKEKREEAFAQKAQEREQEQTDAWLVELERRNMSEMELLNAKYMDEAMTLAEKKQNDLITEEQFQQSLQEIQQFYSDERKELFKKELEAREEEQKGFWDRYYESMQESSNNTDELWRQTFDNFTTGFGNAFASAITDSENAGDAFKNMAKGMAQSMLAALGKIMAQRLVMWALEKTLLKSEAASEVSRVTAEAQSASFLSAIHAYSSTAAIPMTGPALAPAAASTALAITQPMAAAATAMASSGFAGAFDNGGYIPAGQWGITGEYGPEITLGPSHIVGRKQTMSMLQQATAQEQSAANVSVEVHEAPPGTYVKRDWSDDDQRMVVKIMCRDANEGGDHFSYIESKLGIKGGGYK
ncbi:phage tail length tape measure family protein [Vibrio parahaemolyticus]